MASELRLHCSPDSANLPVRIAVEAFRLPFEAVRVQRNRGEHRGPAYLALNPQGLLPVLEDGRTVLFETGAILLHIAEQVGRHGPDGPAMRAPGARPAALKWLFFLSNTLHADLRAAFYAQRYVAEEARDALLAGMRRRVAAHCTLIEEALGGAQGGLVAPRPGVTEVYLACCLRWAQIYPGGAPVLPGLAPWPRIRALLAALEEWEAVPRAIAAEAIPGPHPFTAPKGPDLPAADITG